MSHSLDDIGRDTPNKDSIPDWQVPAGTPFTPEPSAQKHPREREQDIADRIANRELRAKFAGKAYKVAKLGLYGWALLLIITIIGNVIGVNTLSDKVVIAITTATTLNLFAAFLGVIRGLFPSGKTANEKE